MIAVVRLRTHGDRSHEFLHALLLAYDENDVGYIYLLVTVRVGIHKIDALRIPCYDIIGDGFQILFVNDAVTIGITLQILGLDVLGLKPSHVVFSYQAEPFGWFTLSLKLKLVTDDTAKQQLVLASIREAIEIIGLDTGGGIAAFKQQ